MSTLLSIPYPCRHRDRSKLNVHLWSNSLSGPPRHLQCHRNESRDPKNELFYPAMSHFLRAPFSMLLATGLSEPWVLSFLFSFFKSCIHLLWGKERARRVGTEGDREPQADSLLSQPRPPSQDPKATIQAETKSPTLKGLSHPRAPQLGPLSWHQGKQYRKNYSQSKTIFAFHRIFGTLLAVTGTRCIKIIHRLIFYLITITNFVIL